MTQIRKIYQLIALLLLLVFLCPQVLQIVHHHTQTETFALASQDKIPDEAVQKATGFCSICDYFITKPSKQYNCWNTFSLDYIQPADVVISVIPYSQDPISAFVHSWINRGPPTA